jgi:precorrin-3B synthase
MTPQRRGWCPSLYDPMPTGDGLLVRVKPPGARLPAPAARALAEAAAHYGNGVIELTRRGNLQVRGLRPDGVAPFAAAMVAAGLADPDPERERRRVVIAPSLAGDDPAAADGGLAERIEAVLANGPALASKFCIAVDAGGVLAGWPLTADILVRIEAGRHWITPGDGPSAPDRTIDEIIRLTTEAAGKRLFPLSLRAWAAARTKAGVRERAGAASGPDEPLAFGGGSAPLRSEDPLTPAWREGEKIGYHPYPGTDRGALALGLPLRQLDPPTLHALAALSDRFGGGAVRTTPWRALLLGQVCAADLPAARAAAQAAGLATDPADPRLHVTSCIGSPGCASASVPARQDAARLAREGHGPLHLSGCAKGCAYPGGVPALVGHAGAYTLIHDWVPGLPA